MSKIIPCFFFEPKEELYTGEETPLELLLNGASLNNEIQAHINGFLEEELEHPCLDGNDTESYLVCHDDLNNEYVYLPKNTKNDKNRNQKKEKTRFTKTICRVFTQTDNKSIWNWASLFQF